MLRNGVEDLTVICHAGEDGLHDSQLGSGPRHEVRHVQALWTEGWVAQGAADGSTHHRLDPGSLLSLVDALELRFLDELGAMDPVQGHRHRSVELLFVSCLQLVAAEVGVPNALGDRLRTGLAEGTHGHIELHGTRPPCGQSRGWH